MTFSKRLAVLIVLASVLHLPGLAPADALAQDKAEPDAKPAKQGPEWVRDLEQAKKLAKASKKDLMIVFTGLGWCFPCKRLDDEVFHAKEFVIPASKDYVFVEFDSTFGDSPAEKKREELHRKLQQQFLAPSVPTVILADADGVPYAIRTGYASGPGPTMALFSIRFAQLAKAQRDRFLKNAATLTGTERAEQLHKAISSVESLLGSIDDRGDDPVLTFYKTQVDDILRSAPKGVSALRQLYETRIARTKDWHAREAVFAKLKKFDKPEDYPKAIEFIAAELKTMTDKSVRWRLETNRQVLLEWSARYEEGLENARRLQKLPDLSDEDRKFLIDRESYNLFNLKRYHEGLAHYDRRIAAAKGNAKTHLQLIAWKAEMITAHSAPQKLTIPACLDYRQAAPPKSEHWKTATDLLAREFRRAGQHDDAIKVLDELLAIDRGPGYLLASAESYIALGQIERAKAHISDAKKATAEMASSSRKMDRDAAGYLERRIVVLEKRLSSLEGKQ